MKTCRTCNQSKQDEEFYKKARSKDGLDLHCKSCKSSYHKSYYKNKPGRKEQIRAHAKKMQIANCDKLHAYLLGHPCVDCQEGDVLVLEFDHLRDKSYNVSAMVFSHPWSKVLTEIAKCEVVCANCHRRRTAKQFNWYKLQAGDAPSAGAPSS